ncbi:MAG: hypothetical protein ACM3PE_00265 [Deltaproteobacteria bacterium]
MWKTNQRNERDYTGGKNDYEVVAAIAKKCPAFKPDDEDEMVADEPVSCYNCLFRRWTASSFTCCGNR